jgi:hypothetical protein
MTASGATMTESNPKADPEMVKAMRDKLEERLIPKLQGKRFRRKTVVALNVLSIIDHRIGRGEPANPAAWEAVRDAVRADRPEALPQIDAAEAAIERFAAELDTKLAAGGENVEVARATAAKLLGTGIMRKLKLASENDEEDEVPPAPAAEDEPKP